MTTDTNTVGPRGTYGCACASRDARNCLLLRYDYHNCGPESERCQCLCHQWEDDEDEQ